LREHQAEFDAKGINLAAIGLGDRTFAKAFQEETGITFPLLIDEDRVAYKAVGLRSANIFHMFRSDNKVAKKRATAAGHQQTKLGKNPFQLGGSFVFAPGNVDLFAHISETFGDNASVPALIHAVK
jgi:hypothetical protein